MQIQCLAVREQGADVPCDETGQRRIGGRGTREDRRFDLEHAAFGKKSPDAFEQPGAELQDLQGGRRPPIIDAFQVSRFEYQVERTALSRETHPKRLR